MSALPPSPSDDTPDLPGSLVELAEDIAAMSPTERTDLLGELADDLPDLPAALREDPRLERVEECQSPVSVLAQVQEATVRMYVDAPPSAVATRALAAILHEAVDGHPVDEVLGLPAALPLHLGLEGVVSPLRLAGMAGMLSRLQRQVRAATA